MSKYKAIISGGGTGGHIFPAIAIANALKKKMPDMEILFVGAIGRMEMEKVPAAGYSIVGLPIMGLQRRLTFKNLLFPIKLIASLLKARKIIRNFEPDIAIGVGGYASGPLLKQAARLNIPCIIQEQNSYAGITNKLLAKHVVKICVAYEGMERFFPKDKLVLTGNPVRQNIRDLDQKRNQAIDFFGLDSSKKTLLVIGGSLGAKTINESIQHILPVIEKKQVQLLWQTGKNYITIAHQALDKMGNSAMKAFDFIEKMDMAYAASDVVISRAGAISVSEICIAAKPAILIPSPNVAEDHQTKNALALVKKGAALLVKDVDARNKLADAFDQLISSDDKMNELKKQISALAHQDADLKIADEIIKIIQPGK